MPQRPAPGKPPYYIRDEMDKQDQTPDDLADLTPDTGTLPREQARFLLTFARLGNVTRAAQACGLDKTQPYAWASRSQAFRRTFERTKQIAVQVLLDAAHKRAVEGVSEPIYHRGELVGRKRKYSDNLLMFLVKAWAPEYRDQWYGQIDVRSLSIDQLAKALINLSPADEQRLEAKMRAIAGGHASDNDAPRFPELVSGSPTPARQNEAIEAPQDEAGSPQNGANELHDSGTFEGGGPGSLYDLRSPDPISNYIASTRQGSESGPGGSEGPEDPEAPEEGE